MSNFQSVAAMNVAFGNPQGDSTKIDIADLRGQCQSIGHEFGELMKALGGDGYMINNVLESIDRIFAVMHGNPTAEGVDDIRDALCDGGIFMYGAFHKMGINADNDMSKVIAGVMTRFVKDEDDLQKTLELWKQKGVTKVEVTGEYPTKVVKSTKDQPDAPKGKFLKSASYEGTVFTPYPIGFAD